MQLNEDSGRLEKVDEVENKEEEEEEEEEEETDELETNENAPPKENEIDPANERKLSIYKDEEEEEFDEEEGFFNLENSIFFTLHNFYFFVFFTVRKQGIISKTKWNKSLNTENVINKSMLYISSIQNFYIKIGNLNYHIIYFSMPFISCTIIALKNFTRLQIVEISV